MDLTSFILSKSSKVLNEVIEKTKSRMDILREKMSEGCSPGCAKLWLKCAREVLRNNDLHPVVYAAAVRDLLVN